MNADWANFVLVLCVSLFVPFFLWLYKMTQDLQILLLKFDWIKQDIINRDTAVKNDTISYVNTLINEHYLGLENLIDHNKNNIEKLKTAVEHQNQIKELTSHDLINRIISIERFIAKEKNFGIRQQD